MYLARFSYDVLPANRPKAVDFVRREVEAARSQSLNARLLIPLSRAQDHSRWRPLVCCWLVILAIVAVGGAVLQQLGPPPEAALRDRASAELQRAANTGELEPSLAAAFYPADGQLPQPEGTKLPRRVLAPVLTIEPASVAAALASPTVFQPPPRAEREGTRPPPAAQASTNAGGKDPETHDRVLVTLHPARPEDGKALAGRLASRIGLAPDQIDAGEARDLGSRAMIRFYSSKDHPLARRLGKAVGEMGYVWQIENLADRPSPPGHQALEVWLPRQ